MLPCRLISLAPLQAYFASVAKTKAGAGGARAAGHVAPGAGAGTGPGGTQVSHGRGPRGSHGRGVKDSETWMRHLSRSPSADATMADLPH